RAIATGAARFYRLSAIAPDAFSLPSGSAERRPTIEIFANTLWVGRDSVEPPTRRVDCQLARIFSAGNPRGTDYTQSHLSALARLSRCGSRPHDVQRGAAVRSGPA